MIWTELSLNKMLLFLHYANASCNEVKHPNFVIREEQSWILGVVCALFKDVQSYELIQGTHLHSFFPIEHVMQNSNLLF